MSSRVLALKYRPQNFEDVVGQPTTVRILQNALKEKKLHHAYLFTGPRGVGKTSLARIFAKALNCETGPTPRPCNSCIPCHEITEGRALSVIEIDGASNTSVEDVRDLRERIRYLPQGGRYKIYIIDEVHMLSTSAFNALLKTLEEPPPHAIFLFATTDPQKIPSTVLSRLIRFDLRPIAYSEVSERLRDIAKKEKIETEEAALFAIAREARGGLRDALSLLDQIASFSGRITVASVEEVLGASTRNFVKALAGAILHEDAPATLKSIESASASGIEPKRLVLDLLETFRHLLVLKVSASPELFDLPGEDVAELQKLAQESTSEDLDRLFRILQKGSIELMRSTLPHIMLDVLLLRLCHYRNLRSLDEIATLLTQPSTLSPSVAPKRTPTPMPKAASLASPPSTHGGWGDFLSFLKSKKPQFIPMLQDGKVLSLTEKEIVLQFPKNSIHLSLLQDPERTETLTQSLKDFFQRPMAFRLESPLETSLSTESSSKSPSIVSDAMAIFGAEKATK